MNVARVSIFLSLILALSCIANATVLAGLEDRLQSRFGVSSKLVVWEIFTKCDDNVSLGRLKFLADDIDGADSANMQVQLRYDEFVFNSTTNQIDFLSELTNSFDPYIDTVANCSFSLPAGWQCHARSLDIAPFKQMSDLPAPEVTCPN